MWTTKVDETQVLITGRTEFYLVKFYDIREKIAVDVARMKYLISTIEGV